MGVREDVGSPAGKSSQISPPYVAPHCITCLVVGFPPFRHYLNHCEVIFCAERGVVRGEGGAETKKGAEKTQGSGDRKREKGNKEAQETSEKGSR